MTNYFQFQKVAERTGGDIIISTFSIVSALAVLLQGAEGNTSKQILDALHLTISDKEVIANHFERYFSQSASPLLLIANRLYVMNGYQIKKGFKDIITKKFDYDIENMNFADNEGSALTINRFVEQKTRNKIKNLVNSGQLNNFTRLVAVNALYFKANWEKTFDKERTYQDDFYIGWFKSTKVDYMRQFNNFRLAHLEDLDAKILEMNYKTSDLKTDYSFVIILPNKRVDLSAFATNLRNYDFNQIIDKMGWKNVDVKIPKFKIEFDLKLNDVLIEVL